MITCCARVLFYIIVIRTSFMADRFDLRCAGPACVQTRNGNEVNIVSCDDGGTLKLSATAQRVLSLFVCIRVNAESSILELDPRFSSVPQTVPLYLYVPSARVKSPSAAAWRGVPTTSASRVRDARAYVTDLFPRRTLLSHGRYRVIAQSSAISHLRFNPSVA